MIWVNADNYKPDLIPFKTFKESDYVLCLEDSGQPFAGWWDQSNEAWYSANMNDPEEPRHVMYWMPIIELPRNLGLNQN